MSPKSRFQYFLTSGLAALVKEHNATNFVTTIAAAYERYKVLADERITFWTFASDVASDNGSCVRVTATDGGKQGNPDVILFEATMLIQHVPSGLERIWVAENEQGWVLMLPEDY